MTGPDGRHQADSSEGRVRIARSDTRLHRTGWRASLGVLALQQMEVFTAYRSEAMDLDASQDQLIGLTKYFLVRFDPRRQEEPEVLLDPQQYKSLFNHKVNALSTMLHEEDSLWTGSWYGELFRYEDGWWQEVLSRDEMNLGRIVSIVRYEGNLLLGGRGVVIWDDESGAGYQHPLAGDIRVGAVLETSRN